MTAVILSRKLTISMPRHEAVSLADEFVLWREGGIGPGDTFGRDTAFMKPQAIVDLGLRKVHLEEPSVSDSWNRKLEAGEEDHFRYTSDRVLVYGRLGDVKYNPFLLLTILDPGHAFMEQSELVKGLGIFFETERADIGKHFPSPEWVTSGFPSAPNE
jgi:mRNA interferase YafO